MAPSNVNDAIRELMAQLKDFQTGAVGDSFNGPVGTTTAAAGAFTTLSATGNVTLGDASTDTLNVGNGGLIKDASGNLGLGVTPSAWDTFKAFDVNTYASLFASTGSTQLSGNLYYASSAYKYKTTAAGSIYVQSAGQHQWYNAPSGTAGASATITQAMTLDASGNLGVGTTSPSDTLSYGRALDIQGTAGSALYSRSATNSSSVYGVFAYDNNAVRVNVGAIGTNNYLRFVTAVGEAARLDSSGNLGLGVTPSAWVTTSTSRAIQFGRAGSLFYSTDNALANFGNNYYQDGSSTYKYLTTGYAQRYAQSDFSGNHIWYNAPSGTAGNAVTWTQAMTLDPSGNLLVGTTSSGGKLTVTDSGGNAFRFDGSTAAGSFTGDDLNHYMTTYNSKAGGAVTHYQIGFYNSSGTNVGAVTHNFSNTTYSTSSDYRLKENISPMTGALSVVEQLKPCTYTWKSTGQDGQGFIAHELQSVIPDAVVGEKDEIDANGSPRYQGIDTSFLVATLTAAIQELKAEFDAYKASHP
jgi:hypothetical protein